MADRHPFFHAALMLATIALAACTLPRPVQPGADLCARPALVNPDAGKLARRDPGNGGMGGIGGTGIDPDGIGGTGLQAGAPVFGAGDLGGIGGTGIVGVITGFASICVNGLEVQYDANTPVWDNGRAASVRSLAVGQIVAVTASGSGMDTRARGISTVVAAVGPIEAVDAGQGTLKVLGQAVTALVPGDIASLQSGTWVRISGHRLAGGRIAASRIEPLPAPTGNAAQVRGPVSAVSGTRLKVGGTPVELGSATVMKPADGQELWVAGVWRGGVLQAQQAVAEPTRAGLGRVSSVVLEGYVHRLDEQQISLGFAPLTFAPGMEIVGGKRADLAIDSRVQITGRVSADQRIAVDRVQFVESGGGGGGNSGSSSNSGKGSGSSGSSGSSNSGSGSSGSSGSGSAGSDSSGSGSSGSSRSGSGSSGSGSSGSGSGGSGGGGGGSGGGGRR